MKTYDLVYADAPWSRLKGGLRKVRPKQGRCLDYETLSLAAIQNIIGEYDAPVLFMWAIDKYLHEAESLAAELGYRLHARLVWDKGNGIAPAFTVRYSHEYLLWLYKGKFIPVSVEARGKFTTVLRENATYHSAKPRCAYEMIESLYPDLSKIELFARKRRQGWTSWGDQLENHIQSEIANRPIEEIG